MGKDTMQPTTLSDTLEPLRTAQRQWSEESLQRAPQKAVQYITASDIPLVALATPLDWPEDLYLSHLGFPGAMPYTRGVQPTMYRGRLWTTRIFSGFGTAQETNQRYKYLLAQGNEGLSVAFDLPALYGLTLIIPWLPVRSASVASRSVRWRIWRCYLMVFP